MSQWALGVVMADGPDASDAGVGDHEVQTAEFSGERIDGCGDLVVVGDVGTRYPNFAVGVMFPDLLNALVDRVQTTSGETQVISPSGELDRECAADPRAGTRDQGGFRHRVSDRVAGVLAPGWTVLASPFSACAISAAVVSAASQGGVCPTP
jgi:hypothetical protein